ncbi:MAG: hypothetical protein AAF725_09560, partial [Acidobacteriota bacterium]
ERARLGPAVDPGPESEPGSRAAREALLRGAEETVALWSTLPEPDTEPEGASTPEPDSEPGPAGHQPCRPATRASPEALLAPAPRRRGRYVLAPPVLPRREKGRNPGSPGEEPGS